MHTKYGSFGVLSALTLAVTGAYSLPAAAEGTAHDNQLATATKISTQDLEKAFQANGAADDALAELHVHSGNTHIDATVVSFDDTVAGKNAFDV